MLEFHHAESGQRFSVKASAIIAWAEEADNTTTLEIDRESYVAFVQVRESYDGVSAAYAAEQEGATS